MSKRAVVSSALLAATLAACSGGHSSTSMPLAGPAAVSGSGSASTSSASTTASGGSQSTGTSAGAVSGSGSASVGGIQSGSTTGTSGAVILPESNVPPPTTSHATISGDTLSYSSYGVWTDTSVNPDGVSGVFATGTKTMSNAMPRSGSATYVGGASGLAVVAGAPGTPLTGTFNATADFGNAMVTGGVAMNQVGANGALTPYDNYSFKAGFAFQDNVTGTAPIFLGAMTAANNKALTGTAQGTFFGPQAQEIGGTFQLQGGGTTVVGAFGGTATTPPQPLPGGVAGTFTGTADFGSRNVSGGVSINAGPTAISPGTGAFSGAPSTNAGAVSGAVSGSLVGPSSKTMSGTFGVAGGGTTVAGAFGGAKH